MWKRCWSSRCRSPSTPGPWPSERSGRRSGCWERDRSAFYSSRFSKPKGHGDIFATDRSDARIAAALKAGAAWSGNPDRLDVVSEIFKRKPLGLDAVFEASGDPAAIEQAVELVKPGGWIYQIGIPPDERISYLSARLRRKEIGLRFLRRQNRCVNQGLMLVKAKHLDIDWLATHTFKIEEAEKAFATAADRTDGVLKSSIVF